MTEALISLFGVAGGLAGFMYGLWQRERAARAHALYESLSQKYTQELVTHQDREQRLERVIEDMRGRLHAAQEAAIANLGPDAIRARLGELLSSKGPTP